VHFDICDPNATAAARGFDTAHAWLPISVLGYPHHRWDASWEGATEFVRGACHPRRLEYPEERGVSKTIHGVEARTGLKERERNVGVVVTRRGEKGSVALGGRDRDVGAALDEKERDVGVAPRHRPVQGGGKERGLPCIQIGASVQQNPHNPGKSTLRRDYERRFAVGVDFVQRSPSINALRNTAIVVVEHGLEEAAASSLAPLAEDAVDFHVGCV
jgi:hypothetical protein